MEDTNLKKTIAPKVVLGLQYFAPTKEFWWDSSSDANFYKLEMAPFEENLESDKWEEVAMTPSTKINFSAPVGEWMFRVFALNDKGFSKASDIIDIYVGNDFS